MLGLASWPILEIEVLAVAMAGKFLHKQNLGRLHTARNRIACMARCLSKSVAKIRAIKHAN